MIFFDLDGTLLDHKLSECLGVKAFYNENRNHFNVNQDEFYEVWRNISDRNYKKYLDGELTFSQQRNDRMKELFASVGIELSDREAEKNFQTYLFNYESNWKPFQDVIPCLEELKDYSLGIISNGEYKQQILKLEAMGIIKYFEVIITSSEVGIAKPNIEIFKIACERAKTSPQECYYIGDDLKTDILPCEEVGIKGIWLNRKKQNQELLSAKMIYGLNQLKRYL
jgi:putative hydrolase of the HAD superfamily